MRCHIAWTTTRKKYSLIFTKVKLVKKNNNVLINCFNHQKNAFKSNWSSQIQVKPLIYFSISSGSTELRTNLMTNFVQWRQDSRKTFSNSLKTIRWKSCVFILHLSTARCCGFRRNRNSKKSRGHAKAKRIQSARSIGHAMCFHTYSQKYSLIA